MADSSFYIQNPTPVQSQDILAEAEADAAAAAASAAAAAASAASINPALFAQKSANLSDLASASSARTNLGLGSAALLNTTGVLQPSNNLSDLANSSTALTNLGGTTVGVNIFKATTAAAARTAAGAAASGANSDITSLTGLTTPLTIAQGGTGIAVVEANGQCRLNVSSTTLLTLAPYNGNLITIAGQNYAIPSGGVTLANGTFSASTFYYIYIWNNAGTLTLENSTTAHATSAIAGNIGVEIKSGDNTRTLVGCVVTDASVHFLDSDTNRWCISWFNRKPKRLRATFTASRSTTSVSFVEINTEIRVNFIAWADDLPNFTATGQVSGSTTNTTASAISIDGAAPSATVNSLGPQIVAYSTNWSAGVTEGASHYATLFGGVSSGTGTWPSSAVSSGGFPELHGVING